MDPFTGFKGEDTPSGTILSNRGCRAQCSFCSVRNFNGKGVRRRHVQSVVDELSYLRNERGLTHFMFLDDDLFKDEKQTIELLMRSLTGILILHGMPLTEL